ncbi:MAG: hypothetical protein AAF587_30975 [Bacteroidota bacterium]
MLTQSKDLQTELQNRKLERKAIQALVKNEYKDQIKGWLPDLNTLNKEIDRQKQAETLYMWIAAASVIILLISIIFGAWKEDASPNQDLIANHYQAPLKELNDVVRGETDQAREDAFFQARNAFLAQEYGIAAELWAGFPATDEAANYFLAHSYFLNGDYRQALEGFAWVADLGGRYEEKAEFYQLICYLALEDTGEVFQSILQAIASDADHSFQLAAREIEENMSAVDPDDD